MPKNIFRLLKEEDGFVSGQRISADTGITRSAVWKKIRALRREGFVINAVPSQGYKLIASPDLSVLDIAAEVSGDFWKEVVFYKSVDSTNERAAVLGKKLSAGTVIIADEQARGRGRLGRTWISPPGVNIYMSAVLRPEIQPRDATLLTIAASLACVRALRMKSELDVLIKWPNDIVVSGKKLGGILTEVRSDPDAINLAIIGIGINVNMGETDFPEEIRAIATSVMVETGLHWRRSDLIIQLLKEFEFWYKTLKRSGRLPLLKEWKRLSSTLGRDVEVVAGNESFSGLAEDVDEEGMLLVRLPSGVLKKVSTGDLTVLR
jgi:BirA family biotin operon repressor/biotin-[acetyl-CoA-carboxylase] ligase